MRTIRILFTAFVFAFSAAHLVAADEKEKAALAAFGKEMLAIEAFTKEQEALAKENPMAGISMIRKIVEKLREVKTDGLPTDLKAGFWEFTGVIGKMGDLFKGWPEKAEEMQAFVLKKVGENPKFMEDFGAQMAVIEKEMQPAIKKLDELGKKYGLDDLGKIGPGK